MAFHIMSLNEYHLLKHVPDYFVKETFKDYNNQYSGLFATSQSFWNNLKTNVIVKPLAILNLVTFRNLYINTLIFNIGIFFGSVALYRACKNTFNLKGFLPVAAVFLFPSALFFTSTIHRDGLVWMCLGLITLAFQQSAGFRFTFKRIVFIVLPWLLIFALRNYLAILILPALAAWYLTVKYKGHAGVIYSLIASLCILLFFTLRNWIPSADFPRFVVDRLHSFDEISVVSNTYLPVVGLTADFYGFLKTFPTAFTHVFLLPFVWKTSHIFILCFGVELLFLQILFLYFLIVRKGRFHPLTAFFLFVALVSLIMIGYTVPNLGAIVRYRSIYMHLLFITMIIGVAKKQVKINTI